MKGYQRLFSFPLLVTIITLTFNVRVEYCLSCAELIASYNCSSQLRNDFLQII